MNALRALTLIRPMSAAIVHGTKRIENRPMDLPKAMRGVETVVAVHAGKKWNGDYDHTIIAIDGVPYPVGRPDLHHYAGPAEGFTDRWPPAYVRHLRDEGIVGLMLLTGRVFVDAIYAGGVQRHHVHPVQTNSPWYMGTFGYEIKHTVALAQSIACRGMQGWWPVPEDIEWRVDVQRARERLLDEARGMAA